MTKAQSGVGIILSLVQDGIDPQRSFMEIIDVTSAEATCKFVTNGYY